VLSVLNFQKIFAKNWKAIQLDLQSPHLNVVKAILGSKFHFSAQVKPLALILIS